MKKIIVFLILIAVVCVSAFALFGCNKNDTIIIGYDNGFPPMGFQDGSGKDVGFDLDLAQAVFDDIGKKIEFRVIDWKLKETLLNSKEIDVIWNGYTITDLRKQEVSFSMPYMKNSQCVVVKAEDTSNSIEAIKDYEIVVQSGSSAIEAMYESAYLRPSIERVPTDTDDVYTYRIKESSNVSGQETNVMALHAVKTGAAQAVVMDYVVANYLINTDENEGDFRIIEEYLWEEEYGIGVRKEDTELLASINSTLTKLRDNGELAKIANKWGLEDALTDELRN